MSTDHVYIDIISLGCSKNLVDAERLTAMFEQAGAVARIIDSLDDVANPDTNLIINTCGFIGDAKEESINTILQAVQARLDGLISSVSVMGCLSERYISDLKNEIPEVDYWYGKYDWKGLVKDIIPMIAKNKPDSTINSTPTSPYIRAVSTPPHSAYVKISEGCNRFCAFCAIPLITGRHHSRPIDEIAAEVADLVNRGVKEFNIIAQDLSSYGHDLTDPDNGTTGHSLLARLLEVLANIPGVEWIRLHYAYPADFPYDILPVMAAHPNICKYLDIALQHISDNVLTNMRRHIDAEQTRHLIQRIRHEVPGIYIRTTLMVGFPGEGPEQFDELIQFVKEQKFERMGAFAYCEEEGTFAAKNFKDSIPQDEKQRRLDQLMAVQEEISSAHNQSLVGTLVKVLIDRQEDEYYIGRTQWDSPEVDPEVLIRATPDKPLYPGNFYYVTITDAMPFELIAQVP
ncbi:MAG: 30S ribosomal protein S12 methylthiotransferase RimO [Muribaculaceae bacterium]|nr:30S ribosomal protein S12 methylthiotransferase RimO [Muribaculaceae bacterium]